MKPTTIITTEKLNNFWKKGVIPIVQIVANKLKELSDSLSPVAFTGSYNDLTDKPTIPDSYDFTLPAATATVRGGVKIGYSQNGKNYPVETQDEQMFVNVPWTDTIPNISDKVSKTGDTMTGALSSSKTTGTYLAGNQGQAMINSTAAAGSYTMLDKLNSTNGYFTDGAYQDKRLLQYTAKATVDAGTNSVTKSATLLDESGNTQFPGTVKAAAFQNSSGVNILGTTLTGTLAANATSIAFTNAAITTTATIDIYTDAFGVSPKTATVSGNKLTLTFTARTAAMGVKVRVLPS